jgi:hypothetical protein
MPAGDYLSGCCAKADPIFMTGGPECYEPPSSHPMIGTMTTPELPDRLSTNPKSPYYDEALLSRGVGIRFDGQEKTNVEEYCVSEGWIRVAVGKTVDRKGNPLTIKLTGKVEPFLQK